MKGVLQIISCLVFSVLGFSGFSQTTDLVQIADPFLSTDYSDYKFKFGGGGGGGGIGGAYVKPLGNFDEIRNDYGTGNFLILFSYGKIIYDFDLVLGNSVAHGAFQNNVLTIIEDSIVAVHSL